MVVSLTSAQDNYWCSHYWTGADRHLGCMIAWEITGTVIRGKLVVGVFSSVSACTTSCWLAKFDRRKIDCYGVKHLQSITQWVLTFSFTRKRLKEEAGRQGGWEVGEVGEISTLLNAQSIFPYKGRTVSFFPVVQAGNESSQHCLHSLMYTIHTHALTCSHIYTHTHYTPAVAVTSTSIAWNVYIFLCYLLLEKDQQLMKVLHLF